MTSTSNTSGGMTFGSRHRFPGLEPIDLPALRDLARFRLMADDQFARRYQDPEIGFQRLPRLKAAGLVDQLEPELEGARLYTPTRAGRRAAGLRGVQPHATRRAHLSHDVALVDLADHLVGNHPDLRWVTEDELASFLNQIAPPRRRRLGETRHRPDGLILHNGVRTAIELEHSKKDQGRYAQISAWFIREMRVDRVRWYIDQPRVLHTLRKVIRENGFDRDMSIELVEFPRGVRFRKAPGLYVR